MQKCWISFETAAHCGEPELQFLNKWLTEERMWLICLNSCHLHTLWFWVLNNFESLSVLKPYFSKCITCVSIWLKCTRWFSNCFKMLHVFQKVQIWIFFSFFPFFSFNYNYVHRNVAHVLKSWIYSWDAARDFFGMLKHTHKIYI